jgi:uncharacterized protein (DUF885 family)
MTSRAILCALLLAVAACGGGGGGGGEQTQVPPPPPPSSGPSPAAEQLAAELDGLSLDEFYEKSFAALMLRSPERVIWNALQDFAPLDGADLDNLSESWQSETFDMYRVVLEALQSYDRSALDAAGRLHYDIYEWHLRDLVEGEEWRYYDYPSAFSIFGVQKDTETFFTDIHPLATAQDAEDYVARLGQVERKFGQLADHLRRQRQAGVVEPATTLQIALNQVSAIAGGSVDGNPYFARFRQDVAAIDGLDAAARSVLIDRARDATAASVIPGYRLLRDALQDLSAVAPAAIGVGQHPDGDAYYTYILRHHSTTDLTPMEVHQLGLTELDRIHTEMRLIFDRLGYPQDETLQQLYSRVTADGGTIPAASVLPTYEDIITDAENRLGEAFDIFPSADVVVLPDPFGGFYIGPAFDGSRPGAFYAGTQTSQPWYQMPSLAYHEAVPGHHTQIAIAMEQEAPAFRKVVNFTGFVEGWALYAERLAWELGWYDDDPLGDLGRLQYEALRAARLVIDTGIHHLGWSFDRAARFNEENVGWSAGASQSAVARYAVIPGQATAYMLGLLEILEERERARDVLGPAFDLNAFHRALLSNGAVPLGLLDEVVDAYIAEASQGL